MNSIECADRLHEIENQERLLQTAKEKAISDLAHALAAEGIKDVIGSFGQKYQLAQPTPKYVFDLPLDEYNRLGIAEACTPKAEPKLTKTKLDGLLRQGLVDDLTVSNWMQQGWYSVERSGELTVRQVKTKPEEFQAAQGF